MHLLLRLAVTALLKVDEKHPHIRHQAPQPMLRSSSPTPQPQTQPLLPKTASFTRPSPPMPMQVQPTSGDEIRHSLEATLIDRLQLPANSQLERMANLTTVRNTVKVKLRQKFEAAYVYGSHIVVEMDKQEKRLYDVGAEGLVTNYIYEPTRVTLSGEQAISIVATANNISSEDMAKAWNEEAVLILYDNRKDSPHEGNGSCSCCSLPPVQCYLVSFYVHPTGSSTLLAPNAVVNAGDGMILESWNGLSTASETMQLTGVGGNYGRWGLQKYDDLQASVDPASGLCLYSDDSVQVHNLNGATSDASSAPWYFDCSMAASQTYYAINGGYAPANDAALYSRVTLDMYRKYVPDHALPTPLVVKVRYGQNYENAVWTKNGVLIGDGGAKYYPRSSLDVLAHEISHGFTALIGARLPMKSQSGCINEAFSDMAAEAAKFYRDGTNDFVFGRNVVKAGEGIRWLCDPLVDGSSIDTKDKYRNNMEPHRCSGVYNKAFCLLAKTPGWGTDSAFKVFANANVLYWGQRTDLTSGVCCVRRAASDQGLNDADVAAAFAAVGLYCPGSCPPRR